ncbi:hypothetical protein CSKR_100525 [Clonorchis sinensis]|uniref:Uncharacterized protein n=1 Tax=Clonorchis sinensis TaxID=79923 RepID=A0A3R7GJL7_CLOSI|nr:hypothetical protein CSKR_100525 [Clonorchis sinensis]
MADFFILAHLATNFMSSVGVCRQFCLGATYTPCGTVKPIADEFHYEIGRCTLRWPGRIIYWNAWFLVVLGIPTATVIGNVYAYRMDTVSDFRRDFANISCNLNPNLGHFYAFFPVLFFLLFAQSVCVIIGAKLRYASPSSCVLLPQLTYLTARFWITLKLAFTHWVIWIPAFTAVFYASVAAWHVFTIFSTLQAIYIAVNFTFSRPVLDLLHQWHEDKLDELKAEHAILCRQAIKSFANLNDHALVMRHQDDNTASQFVRIEGEVKSSVL